MTGIKLKHWKKSRVTIGNILFQLNLADFFMELIKINKTNLQILGWFVLSACLEFSVPTAAKSVEAPKPASATLIYPRPEVSNDRRSLFPLSVLRLALAKASLNYELAPSNSTMDQERALLQIDMPNGGIDISWTMTSIDRENRLKPIRIPIDKGLLGWRLALIQNKNADLFKGVATLDDFKKFVACQGHDWPDTGILRANGIHVVADPNYLNLFGLVSRGVADYFPRSSIEIWSELDEHGADGLMLDPYLVIHYPTAMYFFVSKKNSKLAENITRGFEKAIADGSYERLFQNEFGEKLRKAKYSSRKVINLTNPLLPPLTPIDRKELWFSP